MPVLTHDPTLGYLIVRYFSTLTAEIRPIVLRALGHITLDAAETALTRYGL